MAGCNLLGPVVVIFAIPDWYAGYDPGLFSFEYSS